MTDETTTTEPRGIIQILATIGKEAGAVAPEKKTGVPFPFRGVDMVVNHLSPYLQKYGVVVVPNVLSAVTTSREDKSGKTVKTTDLLTRFDFHAPDGSVISATTAGLADDYADRSAAQAQSVAFRVALLQTFALPTQSPEPEQSGQVVLDGQDAAPRPNNGPTPAPKIDTTVAASLRAEIGTLVKNPEIPFDGPDINAYGDFITGKPRAAWMNSATDLKKVIAGINEAIAKGEPLPAAAAAEAKVAA